MGSKEQEVPISFTGQVAVVNPLEEVKDESDRELDKDDDIMKIYNPEEYDRRIYPERNSDTEGKINTGQISNELERYGGTVLVVHTEDGDTGDSGKYVSVPALSGGFTSILDGYITPEGEDILNQYPLWATLDEKGRVRGYIRYPKSGGIISTVGTVLRFFTPGTSPKTPPLSLQRVFDDREFDKIDKTPVRDHVQENRTRAPELDAPEDEYKNVDTVTVDEEQKAYIVDEQQDARVPEVDAFGSVQGLKAGIVVGWVQTEEQQNGRVKYNAFVENQYLDC